MTQIYRGWSLHYDPPPIPVRDFDWRATGPDYDASYEGPEDGWVSNGEQVNGNSREEVCDLIDEWFEDQAAADRAAVLAPFKAIEDIFVKLRDPSCGE